jgi:hypothetical protein
MVRAPNRLCIESTGQRNPSRAARYSARRYRLLHHRWVTGKHRHLILHAAQRQPLVFAVENLHWSDAISEEWLASLVERLAGAALLLVVTYRPGYQPPYSTDDGAEAIDTPGPRHQRRCLLGDDAQPGREWHPEQNAERRNQEERQKDTPDEWQGGAAANTTGMRKAVPTSVTTMSGMIQRRCCRGCERKRPAT